MFCVNGVRLLAAAFALLLALSFQAEAALVYTPGRTSGGVSYLIVSGDFEASDDLSKFLSTVQANSPLAVFFDSPGGDVNKALALGRSIRSLRLATVQVKSMECESACSLAFMGGKPRYADPGSIGVHKSSFANTSGMDVAHAVSIIQQTTADVIVYMTEMGVDPGLLQLALKYDSDDIRYLSGSEMEQYHLALNGAKSANDTALLAAQTPSVTANPPPVAPPTPAVASLPPSAEASPSFAIPVVRSGRIQHYDGQAPLKAAPTTKSPTIEKFPNGSATTILEDTGKWYRVRVGTREGYLIHSWVWTDQFGAAPFGQQFVQVKSFDNFAQTEQYVRGSPLPLTAYLASNGWFAITLDRTYSPDNADAIVKALKLSKSVPDDAITTWGNSFVRKVCCRSGG